MMASRAEDEAADNGKPRQQAVQIAISYSVCIYLMSMCGADIYLQVKGRISDLWCHKH